MVRFDLRVVNPQTLEEKAAFELENLSPETIGEVIDEIYNSSDETRHVKSVIGDVEEHTMQMVRGDVTRIMIDVLHADLQINDRFVFTVIY